MSGVAGPSARRGQALLERVLREGGPLEGEYPLVFHADAPGEVSTVEERGEVRAACGLLVRDLMLGGERIRAGLVGSVATHPDHRGQGHASRLLERARTRLVEQGCLLALLWADEPGFYARRGWREAGCEVDFVVEAQHLERLPRAGGATLRAAAPDDHGALHRLYARHQARVDRTSAETRALLRGPGIDTLVLERGRDIAAYACLGRGSDLARCVHEWGGSDDDVLALAREHFLRLERRGEPGPIYLMTPSGARSLQARLEACGMPGVRGLLGMACLLDPAGAAELVQRAARGHLSAGLDTDRGRECVRFAGPGGEAALGPDDLLDVLLPARGARAGIERLERVAAAPLPGLPLPLYVWGLDSI